LLVVAEESVKNLVRFIVIDIAVLLTVSAQQTTKDLMDGTWELDVAASKFDPGPARKSDIRTFRVDGPHADHMMEEDVMNPGSFKHERSF